MLCKNMSFSQYYNDNEDFLSEIRLNRFRLKIKSDVKNCLVEPDLSKMHFGNLKKIVLRVSNSQIYLNAFESITNLFQHSFTHSSLSKNIFLLLQKIV